MAKKKAARPARKAAPARKSKKAAKKRAASARRAGKSARKAKPARKAKSVRKVKPARKAKSVRKVKPARKATPVRKAKAPAKKAARKAPRKAASRPAARKAAARKVTRKAPSRKPAARVAKTTVVAKAVVARTVAPAPTKAPAPTPAASPIKAARPPKAARKQPNLDRPRRTVAEIHGVPSSLDMDRTASAVRTGRAEMEQKLQQQTNTSPALTAGDVDADWGAAAASGDEAPGGDNPTPDQDVVDEIGRALGVEYDDDEELQGGDEIAERDRHRWELDPESSDDFEDR